MQSRKAERDWLIATDSASRSLEAFSPRSLPRSLPARSTSVKRPMTARELLAFAAAGNSSADTAGGVLLEYRMMR